MFRSGFETKLQMGIKANICMHANSMHNFQTLGLLYMKETLKEEKCIHLFLFFTI